MEAKADINLFDHDRRTLLHLACADGYSDLAQYLVAKGAASGAASASSFSIDTRRGSSPDMSWSGKDSLCKPNRGQRRVSKRARILGGACGWRVGQRKGVRHVCRVEHRWTSPRLCGVRTGELKIESKNSCSNKTSLHANSRKHSLRICQTQPGLHSAPLFRKK